MGTQLGGLGAAPGMEGTLIIEREVDEKSRRIRERTHEDSSTQVPIFECLMGEMGGSFITPTQKDTLFDG